MSDSPTSVMECLSGATSTQYASLDFLGFNFDTFMNGFQSGGSTTSPVFPPPNPKQLIDLRAFFYFKKVKVSIKSLPPDENGNEWCYLLNKTPVHEKGQVNFTFQLSQFNVNRSGDENLPADNLGESNVHCGDGNGFNSPHFQCRVRGRINDDLSPNFVGETHYRSSVTLERMHNKIKSYIIEHDGIMLSLLIFVTDLDLAHGALFCCLAALYWRDVGAAPQIPLLVNNISFGTRAPTATEQSQWDLGTGSAVIDGVGFGGPPCDAANSTQYLLRLPLNYLLCTNFEGTAFYPLDDPAPGADDVFNLSLYRLQNAFRITLRQQAGLTD